MAPRKLVFYTHALVGGGAERVWARLASGFAARGDDVIFVVDFEERESLAFLSSAVSLQVLPRGHFRSTLALARLIRKHKPDASLSAISVSNLKHAIAAQLAGRGNHAVLSYHGYFDSEPEFLSRLGYRLTPLLARLTHATIAVSNGLREDLIEAFHAPAARMTTIFNPAAPEPFPATLGAGALAARPPMVLAIGRLVPDKDFVTLLRAFARVKHPRARLTILGEGRERAKLQAEAAALGIADRVDMPGFIGDAAHALASARCFVLTSLRESFSLVCVEALAFGLPVIATDCGGPREILNHPALGRLAPVGAVEELAMSLDACLVDPGDPAPRQDRARAFTLERALDRYDALIGSVVRHMPPPA